MFNFRSNVYRLEWLELVFADRNKAYGAYELRAHYSRILTKALFISSVSFVALFFIPYIYGKIFNPKDAVMTRLKEKGEIYKVTDVFLAKKKVEQPKAAATPKVIEEKVAVKEFIPLKVVAANLVKKDPPTLAQLDKAVIGSTDQVGKVTTDANVTIEPTKGSGEGTGEGKAPAGNGNEVVDVNIVEQYPEFIGGAEAWRKYIQKSLKYPAMARENEVEGKVFVSFIVEKDGSISSVKVLRGIGAGCDEEAARVIKNSPLWKAGQQNKQPVRVMYTMPLVFQLAH